MSLPTPADAAVLHASRYTSGEDTVPIRLPRALARLNRVLTNRVIGLWAPYLPPFAVLTHTGRTSGRGYHTVLMAFARADTVVIALTYGETDWLRNVLAAHGARLRRLGRSRRMVAPRVVTHPADLPVGTRWTVRVFGSALVADLVPDSEDPALPTDRDGGIF